MSGTIQVSSKTYDFLKPVTTTVLPGVSALYFGLAQLWGDAVFPAAEQVVGTIALVNVFLGLLLGLSSKNFTLPTDGSMIISEREDGVKVHELEFDDDPKGLEQKDQIVFKVVKQ